MHRPLDEPIAPELRAVYAAALHLLYALGAGRMLPGRERLARLLERAGNPQLACPSVLVGGTNGKGRLVAALSAVLSERFVTGAFLKPHLKSIRERWRVGDRPVAPDAFIRCANQACDLIAAHGEPISFFEANVLLGSLLFAERGCEIAVWEVGLGGQHDACNLLDPLLSVITNVQYDHQAILGGTLEAIATDKAGIARPGRPLLLGSPRAGWEDDYAVYAPVVRSVGTQLGARVLEVDAELYRPLMGLPDDTNALLQASLEQLAAAGVAVSAGDVLPGLRRMHYRGRLEHTQLDGTPVLLDAAHNADSMRWLGRELTALAPRWVVLFGCQSTKDPAELLAGVAGAAEVVVPVAVPVLHPSPLGAIAAACASLGLRCELPPGLEPAAVDALLEADVPLDSVTELDPPDNRTGWIETVRYGLALSREMGLPVVLCGSIYYLGEILRAFEDGWAESAATHL